MCLAVDKLTEMAKFSVGRIVKKLFSNLCKIGKNKKTKMYRNLDSDSGPGGQETQHDSRVGNAPSASSVQPSTAAPPPTTALWWSRDATAT